RFGIGDGKREEAGEIGNLGALEAVRVTAAVVTFVMGADSGADGAELMDEGGEFLAEDGMVADQGPFGFGQALRLLLPALDQLAGNANEPDVVDEGADFQCLTIFG